MRIVPQSAAGSHSQNPAPFLMLAAPPIAGLIPARVPVAPTPDLISRPAKRQSLRDIQMAKWAAEDAELEAFLDGARQRIAAVYDDILKRRAARAAREAADYPRTVRAASWEMIE